MIHSKKEIGKENKVAGSRQEIVFCVYVSVRM